MAVVLFEDAHWIDPTSRELLDLTAEAEKRSCVVGSLDRSLGAYARAAAFDPSAVMGSAAEELMVCRLFADSNHRYRMRNNPFGCPRAVAHFRTLYERESC